MIAFFYFWAIGAMFTFGFFDRIRELAEERQEDLPEKSSFLDYMMLLTTWPFILGRVAGVFAVKVGDIVENTRGEEKDDEPEDKAKPEDKTE